MSADPLKVAQSVLAEPMITEAAERFPGGASWQIVTLAQALLEARECPQYGLCVAELAPPAHELALAVSTDALSWVAECSCGYRSKPKEHHDQARALWQRHVSEAS